jgi:glycosyltransferase involved in cell wall biosynthesis
MRVWILQTGEPVHTDTNKLRPMRAINLANALLNRGHEVILWTSNFDHFSKSHRFESTQSINVRGNFQIRFIQSMGYKSHFGFGRLLDHLQLGFNLRKRLKFETPPDISFIGYPPIEPAYVMSTWLRKHGKPYMLDVKDAWPAILLRGVPESLRPLGRIALTPYFLAMKKTFKNATSISSITAPYLEWCNKSANREQSKYDRITPLTVQKLIVHKRENEAAKKTLNELGILDDDRFKLTFIGTLNSAFDFTPIIQAVKNLDVQLIIAGDGPQYQKIKEDCKEIDNVLLLGWIDMSLANVLMARSSIMLAPLRDLTDFRMSMPNKFFDAMQNAKPILTSISGYTGDFLVHHQIGVEYSSGDVNQLEEIINRLASDPDSIREMGQRAKEVFDNYFDFDTVYGSLVYDLEKIAMEVENGKS